MEAYDIRARARENLAGNWWMSVGTAFVASIFGALITGSGLNVNINIPESAVQNSPEYFVEFAAILVSVASILSFVSFILGGPVQMGYTHYLLKQHDKKDFRISDLFSQFEHFGRGFAQKFLRGLYTALWALLFIIPGIVKRYSYAMTPFILAENPDMTANEAITASRQLMDGHKGELFWLDLSFIGWSILCVFTLGIGTLFLNPYMNAAHAAFYRDITAGSTCTPQPDFYA